MSSTSVSSSWKPSSPKTTARSATKALSYLFENNLSSILTLLTFFWVLDYVLKTRNPGLVNLMQATNQLCSTLQQSTDPKFLLCSFSSRGKQPQASLSTIHFCFHHHFLDYKWFLSFRCPSVCLFHIHVVLLKQEASSTAVSQEVAHEICLKRNTCFWTVCSEECFECEK